MSVALTAHIIVDDVYVSFGDYVVARIPLTAAEQYRISNTGVTEDEVAAQVAAAWLRDRLADHS